MRMAAADTSSAKPRCRRHGHNSHDGHPDRTSSHRGRRHSGRTQLARPGQRRLHQRQCNGTPPTPDDGSVAITPSCAGLHVAATGYPVGSTVIVVKTASRRQRRRSGGQLHRHIPVDAEPEPHVVGRRRQPERRRWPIDAGVWTAATNHHDLRRRRRRRRRPRRRCRQHPRCRQRPRHCHRSGLVSSIRIALTSTSIWRRGRSRAACSAS